MDDLIIRTQSHSRQGDLIQSERMRVFDQFALLSSWLFTTEAA
jgi:hypothetical protein